MSDFIWQFVKSLTNREKAYFKRISNAHMDDGDKNYLKLFEEIEKMKVFDKVALAKKFEGTSIDKYLSSEINYLKDKLLTSLLNYNLNITKRNKIHKGIVFIEILIQKGFRKEAMKRLKTSKKMAYEMEEFSLLIRLIELEEIILFKQGIIGFRETLRNLIKERNQVINIFDNLKYMRTIREELRDIQYKEGFVTDQFKKYPELYNNPLVDDLENCKSRQAREHWHYIQTVRNYLVRDYASALKASEKYMAFFEEHEGFFPASKKLPMLSNYMFFSGLTKSKSHFKLPLEKLEMELKKGKLDPIYGLYIINARHLELAYRTEDEKLMKEYIQKCMDLIDQHIADLEMGYVQYLYQLIVTSCILLKDYELGATNINLWIQKGVIPIYKLQARLFALIIHFELDWTDLVSSEIILLKKMRKKFPNRMELIDSFYSFYSNCMKYPNEKLKFAYILQTQLEVIAIDKEKNFDFEIFDFYKWSKELTSKMMIEK